MFRELPRKLKPALMCATLLSGVAAIGAVPSVAQAQTEVTDDDGNTVVVVTGYRASLLSSTNAKRRATGFEDSIFAEDMGKFPDSNLAESFNRIPGITVSREISGEGINIAIRGLGTSFTRVLLNGAPVAVASTGSTDSQNTNREVDLDLFPTELFGQLTVSKSPNASHLEGGAAGVVNMRQTRPFDHRGGIVAYSVGTSKMEESDSWGRRGSLLASNTFGNWGILGGISYSQTEFAVSGFETIGWTNANLSATQSSAPNRNNTGGGNWTIPGTVPANAGNGLTTGATIDEAFLLANNPGLTIQQIDNALIPRLGRPMHEYGTKERTSAILGVEYRSDNVRFYVDGMYAKKKNLLERTDMNWVGRNGAVIPLNMKVDSADCSDGCVVTEGTFANAQFFLEYRPHNEDTEFYSINPGLEWIFSDTFKVNVAANWTKSEFHRESPTFLIITPASSGVTVTYKNDGTVPTMTSNVDLNDPANFGWAGGRVNMQDEYRTTETKGIRADVTWGDTALNVQFGAAYDDTMRRISPRDNSQAWQNATCGNNPNVFLPSPNRQPACNGDFLPGASPAGYPDYPAYGTGFSAGFPALTYAGSLIPQSALGNYVSPGPNGYITVDWDRFAADSNYKAFQDAAPIVNGANTGANAGFVQEKVQGAYFQVNGDRDVFSGQRLRYNVGIRFITTDQEIGGLVSIPDPRNTPAPGVELDHGAKYPNIVNWVYTKSTYKNYLPSLNIAYNPTDSVLLRFAASTTMTRANPNTMLPGLNFTQPSADVGTVGNPSLNPFISDNIDLGAEWYTGGEGYVGIALFNKKVRGFTTNGNVTTPFSALAPYGVTYNTLNPTQQAAIDSRGGPDMATVVLTQQVNASGELNINGTELSWVQPLDQWFAPLEGFGFSANATFIKQKGSGAAPAVALGVPEKTYNFTVYYEKGGVMLRLSDTYRDGTINSGANQNGITNARLYGDSYEQVDFSSSFDLKQLFGINHDLSLTFDAINITDQAQRSYFQHSNATFTYYKPGTTVIIGLRGRF